MLRGRAAATGLPKAPPGAAAGTPSAGCAAASRGEKFDHSSGAAHWWIQLWKNVGGVPQQGEGDEMRDDSVSGGKDNNDEYKSTLSVANAILGGDPYWQQLVGQVCLSFYFFVFALMAGEWFFKHAAS